VSGHRLARDWRALRPRDAVGAAVSMMAAAGVSLHALSRYMGHSSIDVTWSNYGHLFPGEEAQAATLQEAFLARALDAASTASG
jgi:integrase